MTLSPATERALEACLDAIARPATWTAALDRLAHAMGAHACLIVPHELSSRNFGVVCSSGLARLDELMERNNWDTPVYEPRGDPYVRRGYQSVLLSQLFTEEEIRTSRFHQEIARPAGCLQWASGIFATEGRYWCLPFFRSTEPFTPAILEQLAEVSRRMAQIVSLSEKIARASAEAEILTLERIGCAALLVDRHGRIARSNRAADELCGEAFGIRQGRPWTADAASLAELDRMMMALTAGRQTRGPMPAPVIVRRDGVPWLLIEVMPVSAASLQIFDGAIAALILTDMTRPTFTDVALLGRLFGLTGAEARLAALLGNGHDLASIAITLGVTRETLRSQLKAVFAKTGMRRQAELVALSARIRTPLH